MSHANSLPGLLASIPNGAWVALSHDQAQIVSYGGELWDVLLRAKEAGEGDPIVSRIPQKTADGPPRTKEVSEADPIVARIPQTAGTALRLSPRLCIQYSYSPVDPNAAFPQGWDAPIPYLPLSLINGSRRISCLAILDSGSSNCSFPYAFLGPLGINRLWLPSDHAVGVGGLSTRLFHNITVEVLGFAQFQVYAGFAEHLDELGKGVLGQNGFFDRFKVRFDLPHGQFEIET